VFQRVIAALGTLALAGAGAAACSSSSSTAKRPVAKPGQIVTVLSKDQVGANGKGKPGTTYQYSDITVDRQGTLYVANANEGLIVKATRDGRVTTLPPKGEHFPLGPAAPAITRHALADVLNNPQGVVTDAKGELYIADTFNDRVRAITRDGRLLNVAGTGVEGPPVVQPPGFGPPAIISGPAMAVRLHGPGTLVFDDAENLYINNFGGQLLKLGRDGIVTTVAGTGDVLVPGEPVELGDGGPAIKARFRGLSGVAVDHAGVIYVADGNRVRRIGTDGVIQTIAGAADAGFAGDGGPATSARFDGVGDIVFDRTGALFVADEHNYRIRRIGPDGTVSTVAGTGQNANTGDGGAAVHASLGQPWALAIDDTGNLYVSVGDSVRMIGAPAP
jgi:uncharacterized protein YjiK